MSRTSFIGFDRKLELEWLDVTAAKAAEGIDALEIRDFLLKRLQSLAFGGEASGSARAKTIRVLLRIWGGVEPRLEPLHAHALELLPRVQPDQRVALHWAMTLAAYPYFADHAAVVGRLLALHEGVTAPQIRRRIEEVWGERETVARTSRHVVRTFAAWGVLENHSRGAYRPRSESVRVADELAVLLYEALVWNADSGRLPLSGAMTHPALFPFEVRLDAHKLRRSGIFRITREGLESDYLALADNVDRNGH